MTTSSTPSSTRVATDVLRRFERVSTATLSSVLHKRGISHAFMHGVLPLRPDLRMAGQALAAGPRGR